MAKKISVLTKIKTRVSTRTLLLVALGLVIASGAAFGLTPPTCKTGLIDQTKGTTCNGGYRNMTYECYDGSLVKVGSPTSCKSETSWKAEGLKLCSDASHSSCSAAGIERLKYTINMSTGGIVTSPIGKPQLTPEERKKAAQLICQNIRYPTRVDGAELDRASSIVFSCNKIRSYNSYDSKTNKIITNICPSGKNVSLTTKIICLPLKK